MQRNASGHDWKAAATRLIQAIPGMVCPLDFTKDVAIKQGMQLLRLLTTNPGKVSSRETVASVMKLIQ